MQPHAIAPNGTDCQRRESFFSFFFESSSGMPILMSLQCYTMCMFLAQYTQRALTCRLARSSHAQAVPLLEFFWNLKLNWTNWIVGRSVSFLQPMQANTHVDFFSEKKLEKLKTKFSECVQDNRVHVWDTTEPQRISFSKLSWVVLLNQVDFN